MRRKLLHVVHKVTTRCKGIIGPRLTSLYSSAAFFTILFVMPPSNPGGGTGGGTGSVSSTSSFLTAFDFDFDFDFDSEVDSDFGRDWDRVHLATSFACCFLSADCSSRYSSIALKKKAKE